MKTYDKLHYGASLLRLTSALLCEINEEWLTGKSYLNMNPADLPQN